MFDTRLQRGLGMKTVFWLFIIATMVLAIWWYINQQRMAKYQQPNYLTERVSRRDIESTVLASGTLEALKQVDVGAQVSGEVSTLYVNIGDRVNESDPIAEIDARTQTNTRDKAVAQLGSRQAALQSAQSNLHEAQQTYQRQKALFERGATSRANLQAATTALETAKSNLEQAKLAVTESQLEVDTASLDLGYAHVNAPISGVVIATPVEQGQTVNAVQAAPTIVTIAQLDTMLVKAEIAEADVSKVSPGMPVYFNLLGNRNRRFETTLQSIDPAPTTISDNTVSATPTAIYYYGKMQIANPDGQLRIGMTANTNIVTAKRENVLSLPMTALQESLDEQRYQVMVIVNNEVVEREVTIGINNGVYAEILEGLNEGDEVVISTQSDDSSVYMPQNRGS